LRPFIDSSKTGVLQQSSQVKGKITSTCAGCNLFRVWKIAVGYPIYFRDRHFFTPFRRNMYRIFYPIVHAAGAR
jgi:hypothetical protein